MEPFIKSPLAKQAGLDMEVFSAVRSPIHAFTDAAPDDSGFSEIYHMLDNDDARGHPIEPGYMTPLPERNIVRFSTPCKPKSESKGYITERQTLPDSVEISPLVPLFQDMQTFPFVYEANQTDSKSLSTSNKENVANLTKFEEACNSADTRLVLKKRKLHQAEDGEWNVSVDVTGHVGPIYNRRNVERTLPLEMAPYSVGDFYGPGRIFRKIDQTKVTVHKPFEKLHGYITETVFPPKSVLESSYIRQMRICKAPSTSQLIAHSRPRDLGLRLNNTKLIPKPPSYHCETRTASQPSILNLYNEPKQQFSNSYLGRLKASTENSLLPQMYADKSDGKQTWQATYENDVSVKNYSGHYEISYSDISDPECDDKCPSRENDLIPAACDAKFSDISDSEAQQTSIYEYVYTEELAEKPMQTEVSKDRSKSPHRIAVKGNGLLPYSLKKTKQRRKNIIPTRSPARTDPRFRGVTVWIQTEFKNGTSRLNISAFYSNIRCAVHSKPSPMIVPLSASLEKNQNSPEQEFNHTSPAFCRDQFIQVKVCASCRTRRTPLWRDAEDGTPLCNACGIRYKKYRLRCSRCWHIPKKDIKTYPNCPLCGAALRFSFHKKTSW